MSKSETTKVNSKDIFSIYQENIDKMFNGVRQSVPKYHQSITNVQQEYLQAFENEGEIGRHTSELQSHHDLVCRLLLEKKNHKKQTNKQTKTHSEQIKQDRTNRHQNINVISIERTVVKTSTSDGPPRR